MAGIKITELPASPAAALTDVLPEVQGGATYQESLLQVRTLFGFDSGTGLLAGTNGGTGVNNSTRTLTYGGNVAFSGAFAFTGTLTGTTTVTFPTSGTLLANTNNLSDVSSIATSRLNLGVSYWLETQATFTQLATAGLVPIITGSGSLQYKIRNIWISNVTATNFSGGGGDRDIKISDGTSTWTTITAALAQALTPVRWGDSGIPINKSSDQISVAGANISISYSGGTTDYSAGVIKIITEVQRVV